MAFPKKLGVIWVFVLLLGIPLSSTHAARSMSITSASISLFGEEEMTVTASISGFTDGETIYVKGAFFQPGTTNYFGYTKNGDSWVKNSASNASQRAVTNGQWDGTLIIKSDFSDSGYKGEGEYSLKVRYYYGSFTGEWSTNVLPITINEPDPTSTLTPSVIPSSNPTSAPTSTSHPTQTTAPTATITPRKTLTPTRKPTVTLKPTEPAVSDILGVEDGAKDAETEKIATPAGRSTTGPLVFSLLFVGTGLGLIATVLAWQKTDIWKKILESSSHDGHQ